MGLAKYALGSVIVVAIALWSSTAAAEAADALERGRDLVRSFDYDAAIEQFQITLEASDATPDQRLEALARTASVHISLRNEAQARMAFHRLLNLDPDHQLEERAFSPRVRDFFNEIRDGYDPVVGLTLEAEATREGADDGHARFSVTLAGASGGVAEVVALHRFDEGADYESSPMAREGSGFVLSLPLPDPGGAIEYYVEARAPSGHVLVRQGAPGEPERYEPAAAELADPDVVPGEPTEPEPTQRREWYRSWWFWTIVGAVVVGGATTAVVLTVPGDDDTPSGSLGSGRLQ